MISRIIACLTHACNSKVLEPHLFEPDLIAAIIKLCSDEKKYTAKMNELGNGVEAFGKLFAELKSLKTPRLHG